MSGITNFRPGGSTTEYSATREATATCPAGSSGASVSRTATRTSQLSLADANALAYNAALAEARSALVCTVNPPVITYRATRSATAYCGSGQEGEAVTREETRTSTTSQDDANTQAYNAALASANAALVCYPIYNKTLYGESDTDNAGVTFTTDGPRDEFSYMFIADPANNDGKRMNVRIGGVVVGVIDFPASHLGAGFLYKRITTGQRYRGTFTDGLVPF